MPRDAIAQARRDRTTALVDVMLLAATADGNIASVELNQLMARVLERPEFEGVHANELSGLLESSAQRLAGARTLEDIVKRLKERLPDHRTRLLAFGLAASVALADRKATRDELGLLKTFQQAFGLTDDEVAKVFVTVESGAPLAEALGEPLERLYAETMMLMSLADGEVQRVEAQTMLENLAGNPAFKETSLEQARGFLQDALENVRTDGLPTRLTMLAHGLSSHRQRKLAFQLASRIAYSKGKPSPAELRVLELLQTTFGLGDEEVARLTMES